MQNLKRMIMNLPPSHKDTGQTIISSGSRCGTRSLRRRLDVSIRLKQMWPFINMRSISVYPQQDGFDIILLTHSFLLCCCHSLSSPLSLPLFLPPLCHAEWASWNFIKHNMCRRAKFMSHICFNHNPFGGAFKCNLVYCTDLRAVSLGVYGSFPQG